MRPASMPVQQVLAEFLGSAGLVTVVIGSGIAAQRLSPHEDWPVDDPAGQDVDAVRRIVDDIDGRVCRLLADPTAHTRITPDSTRT
jgi:hypothetical protein